MTTAICWMCNQEYEPDQAEVDAWGRSGEDFDPLDWECNNCRAAQDELERREIEYSDQVDWPDRMTDIGEPDPMLVKPFSVKVWIRCLAWRVEYRIKKWWYNNRCWNCHKPYHWPFDHKDCVPF